MKEEFEENPKHDYIKLAGLAAAALGVLILLPGFPAFIRMPMRQCRAARLAAEAWAKEHPDEEDEGGMGSGSIVGLLLAVGWAGLVVWYALRVRRLREKLGDSESRELNLKVTHEMGPPAETGAIYRGSGYMQLVPVHADSRAMSPRRIEEARTVVSQESATPANHGASREGEKEEGDDHGAPEMLRIVKSKILYDKDSGGSPAPLLSDDGSDTDEILECDTDQGILRVVIIARATGKRTLRAEVLFNKEEEGKDWAEVAKAYQLGKPPQAGAELGSERTRDPLLGDGAGATAIRLEARQGLLPLGDVDLYVPEAGLVVPASFQRAPRSAYPEPEKPLVCTAEGGKAVRPLETRTPIRFSLEMLMRRPWAPTGPSGALAASVQVVNFRGCNAGLTGENDSVVSLWMPRETAGKAEEAGKVLGGWFQELADWFEEIGASFAPESGACAVFEELFVGAPKRGNREPGEKVLALREAASAAGGGGG